jgi:hypothetical protein
MEINNKLTERHSAVRNAWKIFQREITNGQQAVLAAVNQLRNAVNELRSLLTPETTPQWLQIMASETNRLTQPNVYADDRQRVDSVRKLWSAAESMETHEFSDDLPLVSKQRAGCAPSGPFGRSERATEKSEGWPAGCGPVCRRTMDGPSANPRRPRTNPQHMDVRRARPRGGLLFGDFLLATQEKVTRAPGRRAEKTGMPANFVTSKVTGSRLSP